MSANDRPLSKLAHALDSGFQTIRRVLNASPEEIQRARELIPPQCHLLPDKLEEVGPILSLLHWYKHEWFTWVNSPPCSACSSTSMSCKLTRGPSTLMEIAGLAQLVEMHQCAVCHSFTPFPRYNNPFTLLTTRQGRCGEWANCFFLLLVASGQRARYVMDVTDHVWCEVWSYKEQKFVHCDPCENAYDAPLMYSTGWNKKLSFVIAFGPGPNDVADCTRRYVPVLDIDVIQRRMAYTTNIAAYARRIFDTANGGGGCELSGKREAENPQETVGRSSGAVEWRAAREELGVQDNNNTSSNLLIMRAQVQPAVVEVRVFQHHEYIERHGGVFVYWVPWLGWMGTMEGMQPPQSRWNFASPKKAVKFFTQQQQRRSLLPKYMSWYGHSMRVRLKIPSIRLNFLDKRFRLLERHVFFLCQRVTQDRHHRVKTSSMTFELWMEDRNFAVLL